MNLNETLRSATFRIGRSVTFKLLTICVLILILLIPVSMVRSLIRERDWRQEKVVNEINAKWGAAQTLSGPILSVPYHKVILDEKGKQIRVTRYLHLLPDALTVTGEVTPHVRYRGIYQAVLYQSRLVIEGRFPQSLANDNRIPDGELLWEDAFLAIGISDMRGIRERIEGTFGGRSLSMEPGMATRDVLKSGVSAAVDLSATPSQNGFRFVLNLNGSERLDFIPVGRTNQVSLHSAWPDPSFSGAFLPVERDVTTSGFTAQWNVLHLNRNYPQSWTGGGQNLAESAFGVSLFTPVDIYQKTMRTAKYALMFIVFAFMAFFLAEVMHRQRVHPIQYLLVGLAIIIFYALLLSISEQTTFGLAYLIASVAVIG
ncbi:cell envelope integrity protein CreD [Desulfosarcina cetonica]|uniref:cell envelope integrity protein CreD n=1 Tax=Desulfosarcina cetonica TaxID=90730 RepID=UPI0006D2C827|nr:cell envelope integrity protein CreD [Desulfosarcina cetonica]